MKAQTCAIGFYNANILNDNNENGVIASSNFIKHRSLFAKLRVPRSKFHFKQKRNESCSISCLSLKACTETSHIFLKCHYISTKELMFSNLNIFENYIIFTPGIAWGRSFTQTCIHLCGIFSYHCVMRFFLLFETMFFYLSPV